MSLVVLRSWSDGQPPKVRAIAPPDSDKDEVIVPDHNGRFVTAEVKKDDKNKPTGISVQNGSGIAPVPHPRSSASRSMVSLSNYSSASSSSPSPPVPELRTKSGQFWTNSANRNEKARTLPPEFRRTEHLPPSSLSRESSVHSGSNDSPPSSPVCGSRYKNLGPDLAATIPRRQIIRETWVKESHSNFKKKEMSKSTPALHKLSIEVDELQEKPQQQQQRSELSSSLQNPVVVPRRNRHVHQVPRPVSYVDTFYGSDGEPKFGDRPASVVQVFKKNQLKQNFSQSERNLVKLAEKNPSLENLTPQLIPSRVSLELKLSNNPKKFKAVRSFSGGIDIRPEFKSTNRITERKESLPIFRSELKLPLNSSSDSEFPVHKAIHNEILSSVEKSSTLNQIPSKVNEVERELGTNQNSPEFKDENEEIDLELEALRIDSSRSTTTAAEPQTPLADSPDEALGTGQSEESEMSSTNYSSSTSSPQFFFNDPRQGQRIIAKQMIPAIGKTRSISSNNKNNGSAWSPQQHQQQIPVQCINRHVFLPEVLKETQQKIMMKNGHINENEENNFRTNQRRKNFCDELLKDVILQVPQQQFRPKALPRSSPPPQPPTHDGIIIFDEEEEDELILNDSETDSIGASEREKSVDYISVFHNVQVSNTTNGLNKSMTVSDLTRVIGLDLGNLTTRYASLDKITGSIKIGSIRRALASVDGQKSGPEAISHAISTKSKLIYKWKAKQSFPYVDPYDVEEFTTTLETLLRHYRGNLSKSKETMEKNTQWNLSIHSGMDKKLVREAALNVGLVKSSDELRLINESTAAAVSAFEFLQRLNPPHSWGKTFLSVNIGSTFIHTSGYELRGSKLHIIESSDSQLYESPEYNFIELFSRLFGREFILKFESAFQPSWIEILTRFDEMKDIFYKCQADCYLFLPISFYLEYNKFTGMTIPECIEDNIEEGVRWDRNGAIRFNKDLMIDWLEPIVTFIKTRLKIKTYDSIVLSGGASNQFISNELTRLIPFVQVFNLPDPDSAVVEGLVKIDSSNVTLKSPFSIGVGVMTLFDESKHPQDKCVTRNGKKWCSDVWDTLIKKGQPLTIGQCVLKRSYVGAQPGQNILVLPIFKSDLDDPKLVTSPSVEKCCELRFEISKEKSWREVQLAITCYESELSIVASGIDGEVNQVAIDF